MGLLDDAIREHLELKRRHGADPSEVARQENDALGPARRGPEPLEVPAEPVEAGFDEADPVLIEPEVDPPMWAETPAPPPFPDPEPDPLPEPDPFPDEPDPVPVAEEPPPLAPPYVPPEPEPTAAEPALDWEAPDPPPAADPQPTVAFDVAEVEEAQRRVEPEPEPDPEPEPEPAATKPDSDPAADPADEDVLEETPDFLQETPEHDRLWFEQRPPRDFDFDG
jgi:hypothetical protein